MSTSERANEAAMFERQRAERSENELYAAKTLESITEKECDQLREELATCREALSKTRIEADRAIDDATFARAELKQAHAQILKLAMDLDEAKKRSAKDDAGVTIHACPPKGSGLMPCCGKTPFEVQGDRMTLNPAHVNCDRERLLVENEKLRAGG